MDTLDTNAANTLDIINPDNILEFNQNALILKVDHVYKLQSLWTNYPYHHDTILDRIIHLEPDLAKLDYDLARVLKV